MAQLNYTNFKPEIIVAIVARIGTDFATVFEEIVAEASKYSYQTRVIRITELLDLIDHNYDLRDSNTEDRYHSYIDACNNFRKDSKRKDALSLMAISAISSGREEIQSDNRRGTVYILNQFKKPEEIMTLRRIYGDALIVLSIHSSIQNRVTNLAKKICLDQSGKSSDPIWRERASNLIERDERELDEFGQNVGSAFPLADCVIDSDGKETVRKGIYRLFRLIFGHPSITPTFEEYANNLASQAAYRSADLSRQVGAALFSPDRKILSLGCNEVPKYGGGTYWEDENRDARDYDIGHDVNTVKKRQLVIDIVNRLITSEHLPAKFKLIDEKEKEKKFLDDPDAPLSNAHILDILEYGRALHAEMNAITDAARSGVSSLGGILFVTTFPCHNCAKHIVGAGISKVYYLEPYHKSEVIELYPDSISVDDASDGDQVEKVIFKQFCGITKRRFHLFSKSKLKNREGKIIDWSPKDSTANIRNNPNHFIPYEDKSAVDLQDLLIEANLELRESQDENN